MLLSFPDLAAASRFRVLVPLLSDRTHSRHFTNPVLHTTPRLYQASNFAMPAMSPTMTEGGIVSWKVKEGDEFSAGDVILEIETDKAQIDVEAADDGVMAKIYKKDGDKDIQVGDTIAVIAEPGDDIKTIDIPAPVESDGKPAPKEEAKEEVKEAPKEEAKAPAPKAPSTPKEAPKTESSSSPSSSGYSAPANPAQTLLPSVSSLLVANGISKEDAFAKIKATGPHGRLLKGDILAYLGKVPEGSPGAVADEINKRSHLDLSNIKPAKKSDAAAPTGAAKAGDAAAPATKAAPEPVIFTSFLDVAHFEPEDQLELQRIVKQAIKLAKYDAVELAKPRRSANVDPDFEAIIGPAKGTKFYDVNVIYPKSTKRALSNGADLYDILSDRKPRKAAVQVPSNTVQVDVTVNDKVPGAEKRAKLFLNRLEYHLTVEE